VANPTILTGKLRICAGEPFNAELLKLGCVSSHVPILFQWSWASWIDRRFDPVDPRFGLCVQRTINNSTRNAKGCTWEAALASILDQAPFLKLALAGAIKIRF
jgi:hypothetical protein